VVEGVPEVAGGVVVGVDASPVSPLALRFALESAGRFGVALRVVHAWDVPVTVEVDLTGVTGLLLSSSLEVEGGPAAVSVVGAPGPTAALLLRHADGARLLVVGAQPHGPLLGRVGATPMACLAAGTVPVAVVHQWKSRSTRRRRRVVVGGDLDDRSLPALRYAAMEATVRDAALEVVLAWQLQPHGLGDLVHLERARLTTERAVTRRLTDWVDSALAGCSPPRVDLLVHHGAPLDALLASAAHADLLVVGAHRRPVSTRAACAGLGCQCSMSLTCPVVVVPPARTGLATASR
jgi:nucleotide-binding universal stress UspA family protein